MNPLTRRSVLATSAGALASLAGCTSLGASGGNGDTLTLDTLSVEGSSGDEIPVQPANSVVLLDFFATWCAPCKPQMAELRQIHADFPEVHMLSITWEEDDELVKSFWRDYQGTWAVAQDPEVRTGQEYGVDRLPTMLIYDADGEEVWRHTGLAAASSIARKIEEAKQ